MTLLVSPNEFGPVSIGLLRFAAFKLSDMDSAELYDLAVCLGVSESQTQPIWDKLFARGFIVREASGRHVPTRDMERLSQARQGKPLPRAKAAKFLAQLIANARELNKRGPEEQFFYVKRVAVFGSYLDESKLELGDLDVAWQPFERPGVRNYARWCVFNSVDPKASTRALLRPRSPMVRLTEMRELLSLDCPYQLVYEFDDPAFLAYVEQRRREVAESVKVQQEQGARMHEWLLKTVSERNTEKGSSPRSKKARRA